MAELIAHGTSRGFSMRLLSNGILLTPARLAQLWAHGLRKIFVSLDGLEENHDFHRASPGLYRKTLRGIENSLAAGFNVRVNSVATSRNVDEMPRLLADMATLGVHIFTVFYLIAVGRGRDITGLQVPPLRWRRLLQELRDAVRALPPGRIQVAAEKVFWWEDEWGEANLLDEGRGGGCLGFLNSCDYLNILADGRVYPCVCFIDVAPPLGNVHDRSLGEILHDPAGWAFYWSLRAVNETCRACPMVDPCRGGSRANSRIVRGEWLALDPRCSGDPRGQGFVPVCFMLREDLTAKAYSGFEDGPRAATAGG
jgi:radical SAM protein with 4Fe4S-binding SPASM domain